MKSSIIDIAKGLKALGVKGKLTIKHITDDRINVYIDGEYFGIWDTIRKTFVD